MKNKTCLRRIRLLVEGLALLALRWAQLKTGFDPETGLSRPSLPGTILVAAIVLLAAVEIFFALKLPKGKFSYQNAFAPMEGKGPVTLLAAGSLLLAIGAILLPGWGTLELLTAAAGIAAAAGFILFIKQLRGENAPRTYFLLPSMIFSVLFVLIAYLPQDHNPVFAEYYLQVLTSALIACSFYQLAGFPCREASVRWFSLFGSLTVPLCIACWADCFDNLGALLVYGGCAVLLTPFLELRRAEPVPEEPEEEGPANEEENP